MRHWIAILFGLGVLGVAAPALAQTSQPTPPEHYTLDPHGVDLVTGQFATTATDLVIGQPGPGGIAFGRIWTNGGWRDNLAGTIRVTGSLYTVSFNGISEQFTKSGSTFSPVSNTGSTLAQSGSTITYTSADGTIVTYSTIYSGSTSPYLANNAAIISLQQADGQKTEWFWEGVTYCVHREPVPPEDPPGECLQWANAVRPNAIRNNQGYQIKFVYALDTPPDGTVSLEEGWLNRTGAMGVNLAVDYCGVGAGPCSGLTRTWPSATYARDPSSGQIGSVTDQSARTTTYGYYGIALAAIRYPGSSSDDVAISYAGGKVSGVTDASGAWTYGYADAGTTRTTTASGPLGQQLVAVSDQTIGRATSVAVQVQVSPPISRTNAYQYDGQRRLERITNPEGGYTQFAFDGRGNVTTTTAVAKSGSGLANIVTTATYPSTCANPLTCNRPTATTDALGNVTDYVWNGSHGGLESVTSPAPSSGGVRPQARIAYAAQTAYFKNASGVIVAAGSSVILPISSPACVSGSAPACLGTTDEIRTTVVYGSSGVANLLLPTSTTLGDGSGALAATTAVTYDPNGDVATVDGPLAGSSDTTMYRYDAARQPVGVVGPDPDGGGASLNRARRMTYDARGQVTLVEAGTTPGYTDPNWASFATLQRQEIGYDGYGRPLVVRQQDAAGTTLALQQLGYDAAGRSDCTATRMNPGAFSGLPASTGACALTALGAYGPDRITQTTYDSAGRPLSTIGGVGSGSTITESVSYTANGRPQSLTDGNGNVSVLVYDGFDRTSRLRYPNATGGGTSTTDYEDYGYDAASNVTSYRDRAGLVFANGYDNLNRLGSVSSASTPQRAYAYDNLDRPLFAWTPAGAIWAVYWGWDALNRNTFEQVAATSAGVTSTVSYGYDLAGRRTSITWPDGYYATYDWTVAGDLAGIAQNGGQALAVMGYDAQGRRTTTQRTNGATTTQAYDGISRLTTLAHDLPGTAQDLTIGLAYNPAGQIVGRSVSNNAYVHAPASASTGYANDGLNRVTALTGTGAATLGYDAGRNLTTGLVTTYGYDGFDQLTSAGTATFAYDPVGRLYGSTGSATRHYLYDGQQVIGEYDGAGAVVARYVPGAGLDDVVTAYAGSGTSSRSWLLADERGSVVALTDSSGAASTINTYDEYGVPGSGNAGRFQYTGQMWLADAGVYHYRARAYAPQIGRFLQTDPIGYAAGANLYGYVGGDSVNFTDPLGLDCQEVGIGPTSNVGDIDCRFGGRRHVARSGFSSDGIQSWMYGSSSPEGRRGRTDVYNGGGFDRCGDDCRGGPVTDLAEFAVYNEARLAAMERNAWMVDVALAPYMVVEAPFVIGARAPGLIARVCNCFVEGTYVHTAEGLQAIETVEVGDLILSRDEIAGETALKPVVALINGSERQIWEVTVETIDAEGTARRETVGTTDEHPWRLVGGDWRETAELEPGDQLVTADGRQAAVVSAIPTDRIERTYNLEVEGFHTYFVGEAAMWVHNACRPFDFPRSVKNLIRALTPNCAKCGVRTVSGIRDVRGVSPSPLRSEIHHRIPGVGRGFSDGINLCRACHRLEH